MSVIIYHQFGNNLSRDRFFLEVSSDFITLMNKSGISILKDVIE